MCCDALACCIELIDYDEDDHAMLWCDVMLCVIMMMMSMLCCGVMLCYV